MKKAVVFLLAVSTLFSFLSGISPPRAAESGQKPSIDAGAYLIMEKDDRYTVAAQNENMRLPPASTTKIMTALVVLERCSPDETATVSANAAGTEGSSAYLRAGEKLSVRDLLFCLMLASANDAAIALAEYTAGSVDAFTTLMNKKAQALGLKNTRFQNPHGLSEKGHYTSALDLSLLCAAALDNPTFAKICSTGRIVIGTGEFSRTLVNHNRLLFSLHGCIGVKTGYTINAGRCLVSACKRGDTTMICVTLNCRDDWEAHRALYDYAFSRVRRCAVEERVFSLPLVGGTKDQVEVRADGCSLLAGACAQIDVVTVCPHFLFPDLDEGEKVGELIVYLDGKETARLPLCCTERIRAPEKPGFIARILNALRGLFEKSDEKG